MVLLYTPNLDDGSVTLSEQESRYAVAVLRLRQGDNVKLTDGRGFFYHGVISEANSRRCKIAVLSKEDYETERNFRLHIAIAPTKNPARTEWFCEKSTEFGIDEITPLICRFSERKDVKSERLEKVMIAAIKQSLKAKLPTLNQTISFNDFINLKHSGSLYIAHCRSGEKADLQSLVKPNSDTVILIGPEGDFSQEEVDLAQKSGFIPISLGRYRLRTETAGIAACHIVNLINSQSDFSY